MEINMAKVYINEKNKKGHINPELYGNFSEHLGRCIYEGLYVGENSEIPNTNGMRNDVVAALKEMKLPVLRWPGGCFADEYHWKDGIGPKENRKKMINTHWGGVTEDNSFGTHEFFELCEQIGCKTYINGNVGSGTVQEMSEWVEYMTFDGVSPMADLRRKNGREKAWKVDYFGVGNENWGCGGNMTPSYYGNLYRRYQTYVRNYDHKHPIFKVCCGPNAGDTYWTEEVLKTCFENAPEWMHGFMDGLSLHYYTLPEDDWSHKGSALDFDDAAWYKTLAKAFKPDELIQKHSTIMDKYDPEKKIGLICDEWGTWYDVEPGTNPGFLYQQSTMRDALVAGLSLNIFNKHCDRVKMANIAQLINVLQAVILTEGPKMLRTPTYHVFHMYKYHQDADLVESYIDGVEQIGEDEKFKVPHLQESASVDKDGVVTITLNNLSIDKAEEVEIIFAECDPKQVSAAILTNDMHAYNTFEDPDKVHEEVFTDYKIENGMIIFTMPACSVVMFRVK